MKFVLIFGPQASGKMTIGQALEKKTGLKLFHNHMTIELVQPFFDFGTEQFKRLVGLFRQRIFEEMADSDQPGLIFTYVCAFNIKEDWEFAEKVCELFESKGAESCLVELETDLDERLRRNKTLNRLQHKATKRNLEASEKELVGSFDVHRFNSEPGEIKHENYMRINNTHLEADEVAEKIKERFNL